MTEVTDYRDYPSRSDEYLRQVDPLVMNLLVAKSIPSLASLNVQRHVDLKDEWAAALGQRLTAVEPKFYQNPLPYRSRLGYFRMLVLCEFVDLKLGLAYKEDQRDARVVRYTDRRKTWPAGYGSALEKPTNGSTQFRTMRIWETLYNSLATEV